MHNKTKMNLHLELYIIRYTLIEVLHDLLLRILSYYYQIINKVLKKYILHHRQSPAVQIA